MFDTDHDGTRSCVVTYFNCNAYNLLALRDALYVPVR